MARPGVTQEQVNAAADALLHAGERPTIDRVRARLGTGSPNTLIRLLDSWWAGVGERLIAQNQKLALPDAPDAVVEAASTLWLCAIEHAERQSAAQLHEAKDELAADQAALEIAKASYAAEMSTAKESVANALQAQRTAELHAADIQRLADNQADQIRDVISQRAALQMQVDHLSDRLAATEITLAQQRLRAEEDRQERDTHLRTTEERWLQEVDRARQQAASLQKQCDRQERERTEAVTSFHHRIETLEAALRSSERAHAASSTQAAALTAEVVRLHEQLRVSNVSRTARTPSKRKVGVAIRKKQ